MTPPRQTAFYLRQNNAHGRGCEQKSYGTDTTNNTPKPRAMLRCRQENQISVLTGWFDAQRTELILYKTYIFPPVFVKCRTLARGRANTKLRDGMPSK
jgi:hypothetical protein